MEKDCIFCKIVSGEIKADFLYKGEDLLAFKDINPSAPVHILIIPKKHIRSINDIEEQDGTLISKIFMRAKQIAKDQGIDKSGYKLVFNVERGGGQFVFHLHLHLLGGWPKDRFPRLSSMPA